MISPLLGLIITIFGFRIVTSDYAWQAVPQSLARTNVETQTRTNTTLSAQISSSSGTTFELPFDPDLDWVRRLPKFWSNQVHYIRDAKNITSRGKGSNCTGTLEVLSWLMNAVNAQTKGCLIMAYGSLIHLFREGDLFSNTTGYYDDDFDTFTSAETMAYIFSLESELFHNFGWSIRFFVSKDSRYVIFAQMFASCGHSMSNKPSKVRSGQPAIELYVIVTVNVEGKSSIVRDLWQGNTFPEFFIFPLQRWALASAGASNVVQLQLPSQPISFLDCLYGDWTKPSSKHAGGGHKCHPLLQAGQPRLKWLRTFENLPVPLH